MKRFAKFLGLLLPLVPLLAAEPGPITTLLLDERRVLRIPVAPVLSLTLQAPPAPTLGPVPSDPTQAPRLTVPRLLGLLQKAKAYPLLQQHYPQTLVGVTQVRPQLTNAYDRFQIRLEEVTRFHTEDALVFRVFLRSQVGQEVRYKPDSFAVRVGPHVYYQALSDAAGVIPAQGEAPAYFVIVGTPDGRRHELSPKNEFVVLVSPLPAPTP
jgi:hypothetical protein